MGCCVIQQAPRRAVRLCARWRSSILPEYYVFSGTLILFCSNWAVTQQQCVCGCVYVCVQAAPCQNRYKVIKVCDMCVSSCPRAVSKRVKMSAAFSSSIYKDGAGEKRGGKRWKEPLKMDGETCGCVIARYLHLQTSVGELLPLIASLSARCTSEQLILSTVGWQKLLQDMSDSFCLSTTAVLWTDAKLSLESLLRLLDLRAELLLNLINNFYVFWQSKKLLRHTKRPKQSLWEQILIKLVFCPSFPRVLIYQCVKIGYLGSRS